MKETILYTDIIKRFQEGEKDFSGKKVVGGNFDGLNLSGIIFRDCILTDVTFLHSDLTDADFSKSYIDVCGFSNSKLVNAKFIDCKIELTGFMNANLDKTDFTNADISWCPFFDSNHSAAEFKNATMHKVFYTVSEVSEEDFREGISRLGTKLPQIRKWRAVALGTLIDKTKEQMEGFKFAYGKGMRAGKGYSQGPGSYSNTRNGSGYASGLKDIAYAIFGGKYDAGKRAKQYSK